MKYVMVVLGGGAGSLLRYLTALALPRPSVQGFPWSTAAVNLLGCLLIGFLYQRVAVNEPLRMLVITGLLGGFTTFSAFGLDGIQLMESKQWMLFFAYVTLSVAGGLLLVWLGYRLSAIL